MSTVEVFNKIEEGDTVKVDYGHKKEIYDVFLVDDEENKSRVVLFKEFVSDTKLVTLDNKNKVYIEKRADAHPREWTEHILIDNLTIM